MRTALPEQTNVHAPRLEFLSARLDVHHEWGGDLDGVHRSSGALGLGLGLGLGLEQRLDLGENKRFRAGHRRAALNGYHTEQAVRAGLYPRKSQLGSGVVEGMTRTSSAHQIALATTRFRACATAASESRVITMRVQRRARGDATRRSAAESLKTQTDERPSAACE